MGCNVGLVDSRWGRGYIDASGGFRGAVPGTPFSAWRRLARIRRDTLRARASCAARRRTRVLKDPDGYRRRFPFALSGRPAQFSETRNHSLTEVFSGTTSQEVKLCQ
jgi:hypothetical protein